MLISLPVPIPVDVTRDWFDVFTLVVSTLAAVGTLLAVFFSVAVARRAVSDGRRAEASRVTAWPGEMDPRIPKNVLQDAAKWAPGGGPDGEGEARPIIVIRNDSGSTIHDVLVAYAGAWGHWPPDKPVGLPVWHTMVPPGDWYVSGPAYFGEAMDVRTGLMIEFTDANGGRWMRAANGKLATSSHALLNQMQQESKPGNAALTRL